MMASLSVYSSAYIQCLFLPFLCTLLLCDSLHCRSTLIPFARFAGFTAVVPFFFFFLYILHLSIFLDLHTYLLPDLSLILDSSLLVSHLPLLYIFPSRSLSICFIHFVSDLSVALWGNTCLGGSFLSTCTFFACDFDWEWTSGDLDLGFICPCNIAFLWQKPVFIYHMEYIVSHIAALLLVKYNIYCINLLLL